MGLLTEADLYPTLYRLEAAHLLQSDWHEAERTRRTYRLTATALARAEANGWPELPFRGGPGPHATVNPPSVASQHSEPTRSSRIASPDPEAGSWFVPPKAEPAGPAGRASIAGSTADLGAGATETSSTRRGQTPSTRGGAASEFPAVARYADELGAALDLPRIESDRVRQEIRRSPHGLRSAARARGNGRSHRRPGGGAAPGRHPGPRGPYRPISAVAGTTRPGDRARPARARRRDGPVAGGIRRGIRRGTGPGRRCDLALQGCRLARGRPHLGRVGH